MLVRFEELQAVLQAHHEIPKGWPNRGALIAQFVGDSLIKLGIDTANEPDKTASVNVLQGILRSSGKESPVAKYERLLAAIEQHSPGLLRPRFFENPAHKTTIPRADISSRYGAIFLVPDVANCVYCERTPLKVIHTLSRQPKVIVSKFFHLA